MKRLINLVSFGLVAVAAYVGCSSDDTTTKPAASTDAGSSGTDSGSATDSGGTVQDSGTTKDSGTIQDTGTADTGNAACTAYCTCMQSTCPTEMPANCVATCQSQTTWDLSCRTTHCGLAGSGGDAGAALHCSHASGVSTCQ